MSSTEKEAEKILDAKEKLLSSTVIKLSNILSLSVLQSEDKFIDATKDIYDECSKHGTV